MSLETVASSIETNAVAEKQRRGHQSTHALRTLASAMRLLSKSGRADPQLCRGWARFIRQHYTDARDKELRDLADKLDNLAAN